jgi:hypothetical protein
MGPDVWRPPVAPLARLRERAETAAVGYSLVAWPGVVPEVRLAEVAAICRGTPSPGSAAESLRLECRSRVR